MSFETHRVGIRVNIRTRASASECVRTWIVNTNARACGCFSLFRLLTFLGARRSSRGRQCVCLGNKANEFLACLAECRDWEANSQPANRTCIRIRICWLVAIKNGFISQDYGVLLLRFSHISSTYIYTLGELVPPAAASVSDIAHTPQWHRLILRIRRVSGWEIVLNRNQTHTDN